MKKISKILAPVTAAFIMLANCPKPSAITIPKSHQLSVVYAMCQNKPFEEAFNALKKFEMTNQKARDILDMVKLSPVVVESDEELSKLLKVCPNIETVQIEGGRFLRDIGDWPSLLWTKNPDRIISNEGSIERKYKNIIILQDRNQNYFNNVEVRIHPDFFPYVVGVIGVKVIDLKHFCNLREWSVYTGYRGDFSKEEIVDIADKLEFLNKIHVHFCYLGYIGNCVDLLKEKVDNVCVSYRSSAGQGSDRLPDNFKHLIKYDPAPGVRYLDIDDTRKNVIPRVDYLMVESNDLTNPDRFANKIKELEEKNANRPIKIKFSNSGPNPDETLHLPPSVRKIAVYEGIHGPLFGRPIDFSLDNNIETLKVGYLDSWLQKFQIIGST